MAFNGLAVYDNFSAVGEDVSDLVALLSPYETPLLDALGASERPAQSVYHEWMEESLNPITDVLSTAVSSTGRAAGDQVGLNVANAERFRQGDLIKIRTEVMLVNSAFSANTVGALSGYGGSTIVNSLGAGATVEIIANASLEGSDTDEDRTPNLTRKGNYTQIFKVGVKASGTARAVGWLATRDRWADTKLNRTREVIRELERTVLWGRTGTATIGSDSSRRTMAGIIASLNTNIQSWATTTDPKTLAAGIDEMLQRCYDQGSKDVDLLVVGVDVKQVLSQLLESRVQVASEEREFARVVDYYLSDFGRQRIVLDRWMSAGQLSEAAVLGLDSSRAKVVPLVGRSFTFEELAKEGDYVRGHIVGEYTLELHNENAHGLMQLK